MTFELTRRRLLIAAIATAGLETGVLATMMTTNNTVLANGTSIRLKTVPVDPRDLLRGEYVVLNYEFSSLSSTLIEGSWPEDRGTQTLWVRLRPDDENFWHPVGASFGPLEADEGSVILRSQEFDFQPMKEKPSTVRAEYGLERYYVAEGEGKAIEDARNNHQVVVDVRVLPDGTGRIASLDILPAQTGG